MIIDRVGRPVAVRSTLPPVPMTGTRSSIVNGLSSGVDRATALRAYAAVGTLYAVVRKLSNSTAACKWELYRKRRPREDPDTPRRKVLQHPALTVWNSPNAFMSDHLFRERGQQYQELTGETWWVMGRSATFNMPESLWPVRPDRIEPVLDPKEFLIGYIFTGPKGEQVPLTVDEVILMCIPDPNDPVRGIGPVQSIMSTLETESSAAAWTRNFFLNGARPGGIIKIDANLDDAAFRKMRSRWNEQHRGVSAAHRVALLEQGEWIDTNVNMKDMDLTALRNLNREIVLEAFGVSKTMLGRSEDVNRATAEAARAEFAQGPLDERLVRIRSALNNHFLPQFGPLGEDVEFDFCNPIPEDEDAENKERDSRANAAKTLIDAGVDAADVLEYYEFPPMRFERRASGQAGTVAAPPVGESS